MVMDVLASCDHIKISGRCLPGPVNACGDELTKIVLYLAVGLRRCVTWVVYCVAYRFLFTFFLDVYCVSVYEGVDRRRGTVFFLKLIEIGAGVRW